MIANVGSLEKALQLSIGAGLRFWIPLD